MFGAKTFKEYKASELFQDKNIDICGYTAIDEDGDKIGKIHDYVMDDAGYLRYLVVDTGFWIFGKKILVPVGQVEVRDEKKEVLIRNLTREQAANLPAYEEGMAFPEGYESQVMSTYAPEERVQTQETGQLRYENYAAFNAPKHLKLIEEHLRTFTHREKMGEVRIRKEVETRMETLEIPVTEERVIIERTPVGEGRGSVDIEEASMNLEGEEITIPLYKDEVDVTKQSVVSEEVTIRKEQETKQRQVQGEVRKERLAMENQGSMPVEDKTLEARKAEKTRRKED